MKKYYCDHCKKELYGEKLTIKTNDDFVSAGFNIISDVEGEEVMFKNWQRLDFCSKNHFAMKLFGG